MSGSNSTGQLSLGCVICADPRISSVPGEALRMLAGIVTWKAVSLWIWFSDDASVMLTADVDGLVNNEAMLHHLSLLRQNGVSFWVGVESADRDASRWLPDLSPVEGVAVDRLAASMSSARSVMTF